MMSDFPKTRLVIKGPRQDPSVSVHYHFCACVVWENIQLLRFPTPKCDTERRRVVGLAFAQGRDWPVHWFFLITRPSPINILCTPINASCDAVAPSLASSASHTNDSRDASKRLRKESRDGLVVVTSTAHGLAHLDVDQRGNGYSNVKLALLHSQRIRSSPLPAAIGHHTFSLFAIRRLDLTTSKGAKPRSSP